MDNIVNSTYNIQRLDEYSSNKNIINDINPVVKLIVTMTYVITIVTFGKYEVSNLIPYCIYPIIIISLADLPLSLMVKRLLVVLPFVIGIGILNPILDNKEYLVLYNITISRGWISFISLTIKCILTVTASLILIATTSIEMISSALVRLRVPKILVTQILLTYRYIYVLFEETGRVVKAYQLRAPTQKGVYLKNIGSLLGLIMLRAFDRAGRVYNAMLLRGYTGDYYIDENKKFSKSSIIYLLIWIIFFIVARVMNISVLFGNVLGGFV